MQLVPVHSVEEHPDLGFSFFGEEAVEEVKKFVAEVVNKEVAPTSSVLDQIRAVLLSEVTEDPAPQDAVPPS